MQLKQALDTAYQKFLADDVPSPRLNAELLLMFVLGRDRAYLFTHPERQLTTEEAGQYEEVVAERARGCPTQYITGHQEFWGLDLLVSPAVLIPRPETEHVIETVLELVQSEYAEHLHHNKGHQQADDCERLDKGRLRMIDVGTGSGCIALALASELPSAEIHGCDLSDEALEMARINAARHGLGSRVLFRKSDLLDVYLSSANARHSGAAAGSEGSSTVDEDRSTEQETTAPKKGPAEAQFDFVISNPPYVGLREADKVQRQVRDFEPRMAVFAGEEGMDVYRRLIPQAELALVPGGWFVTEIGFSTEQQVKELLKDWTDVRTTADLQGIPRVVAARKAA
ncbi:MAG TPA: peptide chain release factor N(5)-glutamine methyltransferase [Candidatus Angelobacter sp.]|jgi:release factor glutamine methyltransferase|nr:peptide chain release factor N(5)-glutamine methyltransferase [Candidatus Angelobacter sp.]